jgi:hypothetical protein
MLNLHPTPGMGWFMPARWSVPQNPLAVRAGDSGLGVFLPAHWTIPQNPLGLRSGLCKCGVGAIVEGFPLLPENPIVLDILAKQKLAEALEKNPLGPVGLACGPASCQVGLCGMGVFDCGTPDPCPCELGSCGGNLVTGLHGLGDLNGTLDDLLGSVTSSMSDWKTWAMVGAGVVALVMLTGGGGSQRRAEITAARAQYKAKVAGIRASRPRRYQKYV